MRRTFTIDKECNKIFNFWKLEEYFTPSDYPDLIKNVKENGETISFDTYYNEYDKNQLPLDIYKAHNDYLKSKNVPSHKLYNRANIYCGQYKLRKFIEKMVEECNLNLEDYADINEIRGKFYIFSVQIDLDGHLTEEGIRISPFFYAVVSMIKAKGISANIMQKDIDNLNEDINEIMRQKEFVIVDFLSINQIKEILYDKLGIKTEKEIGLECSAKYIFACKGLKENDETTDFNSFYLNEIEKIQKNYRLNTNIINYTTALLTDQQYNIMIDSDIESIQKWLDVDKFPLAKYPSRYSPTLMQQVAINISIANKDRKESIFSVNGPPGTGKTTLLKEIVASNVEQLAEVLIKYGINKGNFRAHNIESASNPQYTEKYYEIPDEIAKYGILVVSNNNKAVENISLDLPKANTMLKNKTMTSYFDRNENKEVYFSAVADSLLEEPERAWGLISARMGKKTYISDVLNTCIFRKKNDSDDKITLDSARADSITWEEAVIEFNKAKEKVLLLREEIKKDKAILFKMYKKRDEVENNKFILENLLDERQQIVLKLNQIENEKSDNENNTLNCEDELKYIKNHASFLNKICILFHIGKIGKHVSQIQNQIEKLIIEHKKIIQNLNTVNSHLEKKDNLIEEQRKRISNLEKILYNLEDLVYGDNNSLRIKYKNNLADKKFYENIKENETSQDSCPWTFAEYDIAREKLFYASLQVRKAFILNSPYIRRNLYVYEKYNNGEYTEKEKYEIFPHLFNSLAIVVPVISSTLASIGRFLKHAGNQSLGMLIVDESGQAIPQSVLGALFRTKNAVIVGDPLQVEPIVTIPQTLIDILADSTGVVNKYKSIENSVQTFADKLNEFSGTIGERKVGCPLVVHRRCIEPMFSISNMISYDNRMFNMTNKKDELLLESASFLIKKSGWLDVKGFENGDKDHFVKEQAIEVCRLLDKAILIYDELFSTEDKIFIISPFKSVVESMRKHIIQHYLKKGYEKEELEKWTNNCIGTVHTFQGKEANEVLFVLGCSSKSVGAMNWVVKKANILNVAVTRAKYRILFIGNLDDWKKRRYFNNFIPKLIDKI